MTTIVVEETVKTVQKEINNVTISVVALTLGVSCVVRAECRMNQDYACLVQTYLLEGAEYEAWGNNDSYIIEYVMTKLGLTPVPVPPPLEVGEEVQLTVEEIPN